ncbi:hypothetical protein [Algibacter luteus]|uniref:hypothetical protein n=1 Tax=Algibacter luteus TaxID=1178825 RepID=UPI002599466B|nr:hypothetical protein [Algibacter luteus]WJJ95702.1 hypothetical protein O5O44_10750 [Algibacter luteus]
MTSVCALLKYCLIKNFIIIETKTKANGRAKAQNATVKKDVQKKLTEEAIGKTVVPEKQPETKKPTINLDDRIQKFEKLRGLATQRERLAQTLSELTKFNYNQSGSASFHIKDSQNLEFKTTNTNLIKLVTSHLQSTPGTAQIGNRTTDCTVRALRYVDSNEKPTRKSRFSFFMYPLTIKINIHGKSQRNTSTGFWSWKRTDFNDQDKNKANYNQYMVQS